MKAKKLIKCFFRARKQSDYIKLAIWFFLGAAICLLLGAMNGYKLYRQRTRQAELELSNVMGKGLTVSERQEICNKTGAKIVSGQIHENVQLTYKGKTAVIDAVALSKEYVRQVYGANLLVGEGTLYLNQMAYRRCIGQLEAADVLRNKTEFYGTVQELQNRKLRLVQIEGMQEDTPLAFFVREESQLKNADSIRVFFKNQPFDGEHITVLEEMGYIQINKNIRQRRDGMIEKIIIACLFFVCGSLSVKCDKWKRKCMQKTSN